MSGNKSVDNGLKFEAKVYAVLKALKGVTVIRNIPYPSIYSAFGRPPFSHHTRMEFRAENITLTYKILNSCGKEDTETTTFKSLNIECKYQECAGSVDEKYPLVHQNALISDAEATLFVYQSPDNKIKKGALNYMNHVALHSSKRLIILEYSDFVQSLSQSYNVNFDEKQFITFPLPEILKEGNNANEIDTFFQKEINEYEALGKTANKRFQHALSFAKFEKKYQSYLDLMYELALKNLKLGLRYCGESHGFIADIAGTRRGLEIELKEYNRDLFDE